MVEEKHIDLAKPNIYPSWTNSTIRYSDLDPNGHVNNGAINAFFEDGRVCFRNEYMLQLGDDILAGFVLVKFSVNYLAPLFFPGSVDIGTVVTRVGRSSYNLGQGIFDGKKCVATAEVVTVSINSNTKKSQELTRDLRAILERAMKV